MSDLVVSPLPPADRVPPRRTGPTRIAHALTIGLMMRLLARIEHFADHSELSRSAGARRIQQTLALMFGAYAVVVEAIAVSHGDMPTGPVFVFMVAVALFIGRGGRFVYYFVPVLLGLFSYILAGQAVAGLKLPVHYTPQIEAERWLPGPIPTLWLQHHLYHGRTGPLEVFAVAMYLSHFWIALAVAFGLALTGRGRAFATLMFSILTVSILGEITFVLVPTAPPWLAAQHGYLPPVHHILKDSLYDLHLTRLANFIGNSNGYDVTAAVPSLHVAFPLLCLFTARAFRLPRWASLALACNTLGVVFAIVYTGDHFVVDALAGGVYASVAWLLVRRLMARKPGEAGPSRERVAQAESA